VIDARVMVPDLVGCVGQVELDRHPAARWSLTLAAEMSICSGNPPRSAMAWILEPDLPGSTGLGPVRFPFECADVHAVDTRARPVDLAGDAEDVEGCLVQGGHHAEADPLGEPAVRGAPETSRAVSAMSRRTPARTRSPRASPGHRSAADRRLGAFPDAAAATAARDARTALAVLLHVIYARLTNDLELEQPQTRRFSSVGVFAEEREE
jgi:hypothetical protein